MTTTRFTRTGDTEYTPDSHIDRYVLEVRPGHTVSRTDETTTMYAGRKGRAASVEVFRTLTCTCGGSTTGGTTVRDALDRLTHFEDDAERVAYEAAEAAHLAAILRTLEGTR